MLHPDDHTNECFTVFFGLVGSDSLAFANAIFRVDCSYSGHTVRVACHHSGDEFELAFVRDFVILAISDNNLRVYMICIYIYMNSSFNKWRKPQSSET